MSETPTVLPGFTRRPSSTSQPTRTAPPTGTPFPTRWRDFTPTPNSTPGVWPEFSSEFSYPENLKPTYSGTIHYSIRYPADWFLYPGYTIVFPGKEWQWTYIQNYEQIGDTPDQPSLAPGKVQLEVYTAGPCTSAIGKPCPTDLPLLSNGLPGTQEIKQQNGFTYWRVNLYAQDYQFGLIATMPGTPEENAELIQILEEILASVRLW
ncbi:MAG: hypothetical protein ACOY0R_15930 [Chloroflexota bacterium]